MAFSTMDDNNKKRSYEDPLPHQHDELFEIGILRPHNPAAKESFSEVVQRFKELPKKLQRNIRAKVAETKTQHKEEGSVSDHGNDLSAEKFSYEGHFVVSFYRDVNGKYDFECTIGGGDSKLGENCGVSHLVTGPGQKRRGVVAQHMSIGFDEESGMIAMAPLSKDHPVVVFQGNGIKTIRLGEKHLVEDLMTLFAIGETEYIFVLHELNNHGFAKLRRIRDRVFYRSGLSHPDWRIQPVPTRQPFNRIGSTILHRLIARGRWSDIWSGVDVGTGNVVAVKHMLITEAAHRDFLDEEVTINLNFPAHTALLQAQEICDDMGRRFGPGQAQACLYHFRQLEFPYNMYIAMPMMENDVTQWWSSLPPHQRRHQDGVEVFRLPAEMVASFHKAGYILRDVSAKNTFKKKGALVGMLGDFGMAIHATTHTLEHLGPVEFRAPECDGKTVYTDKIDVYSFGIARLCLLYPQVFTDDFGFDRSAPQGPAWYKMVSKLLDYHMIDSDTHLYINSIIKYMIHPNEARRPSMALVVKQWPTYKPARPAKKLIAPAADTNGPSAKRAKMDKNGGYIQTAVAPLYTPPGRTAPASTLGTAADRVANIAKDSGKGSASAAPADKSADASSGTDEAKDAVKFA